MQASIQFKDERGNHRILTGQYQGLKEMIESVDDISWNVKQRANYARSEVEMCTGIIPASTVFICIEGGRK